MKRGLLLFFAGLLAGLAAAAFFGENFAPTKAEPDAKADAERDSLKAEIHNLQEKLAAREKAWVQFNEDWSAARAAEKKTEKGPDPSSEPTASGALDPSSFPARFNRAMQDQSQTEWTLEECAGVQEGAILEAAFFRRGAQGAVSGLLRCQKASLVLPPSPDAAWLLCQDGYSIEEGAREALPEEGHRIELAPVRIEELRAALPELFVSGKATLSDSEAPSTATAAASLASASAAEILRERLDQLLAKDPGGYRLVRLGSATPRELKDLEIEERSGDAVTARYLAAWAWPRFDAERKTVELILEQGSIERKGKTSPIPVSGFRIHFPKVSPSSWRAAGGPAGR